jgi:molecular chaperone GrpE
MSDIEEDAPDAARHQESPPDVIVPGELVQPDANAVDLEVIEALAEEDDHRSEPATDESQAPIPAGAALEAGVSNRVLDAVGALASALGQRLDALETKFDRELRAEATRERIVDRLHSELQEYKQDFLLKVQRPIFIDLIQLHDDIGKIIETRSPGESGAAANAELRSVLASVQTGIEDILYRQGVEPFRVEQEGFDPRRQRAVSTVPTEDPSMNKLVAARLRVGFQSGERLIRPELVSVYTLRPGSSAANR